MSEAAAGTGRPATVLLVHGIFHGAWCWQAVLAALAERGVPALAVDRRQGSPPRVVSALATNAALVRAALDEVAGPVVLTGHSAGCRIITEAGTHPAVRHLVYIAGVMPDGPDDPLTPPQGSPQPLRVLADGSLGVDRQLAREHFFTGCDEAVAERAVSQLAPQLAPFPDPNDRPTVVAWRHRPATYAVCTADTAVDPQLQQRMAERASERVSWPTGHSPFLSHPELVADLLAELAGRYRTRPAAHTASPKEGSNHV